MPKRREKKGNQKGAKKGYPIDRVDIDVDRLLANSDTT
jgi:hypothetical protein